MGLIAKTLAALCLYLMMDFSVATNHDVTNKMYKRSDKEDKAIVHKQIVLPSQVFHFEGTKGELNELEEFLAFMQRADEMFEWSEEDADDNFDEEGLIDTSKKVNDNHYKEIEEAGSELKDNSRSDYGMLFDTVEEDMVAY